ncbi:chemotaxis protein CheD [Fredinandcohnia quinoae]|uniref:Probable chemoreceptor glutamine deamidase CheD n=1 Tax=Fredinandcohnia quinoae TaxID=2918902 RepID=A0AAW5DSV9_9BACI|nr:chemotaxis protein CheD [Fredinandcohnia sp. SECRCQ15]MCH1623760.1 chemotaxis protein CheD [Fredinandcohnia sp. SECRCQ15]
MIDLSQIIKVGIADMNVIKAPQLIRTSGLGSCVGVVIFDQSQKVAGLAHIMLPSSTLSKVNNMNVAKYADTAIEELINNVIKNGGRTHYLKAKIAGGAQMFQFQSGNDIMRIGPRNVEAVLEELKRFKISLLSKDVGGSSGRTIEFDPETAKLKIRTVNQGIKEI